MFNMNPRVSDSPLDAPRDFKTYCHQAAELGRRWTGGEMERGVTFPLKVCRACLVDDADHFLWAFL